MNKKWLFGIILVLTILAMIVIIVFNLSTKYKKLIISESKWEQIISGKELSTSISLKNIKFNDYNLLIDEENSVIYYSVVDVKNKFNPSVEYNIEDKKVKIAFNKKISEKDLESTESLKVLLYDDDSYRIYNIVATNYPILNITYKGDYENIRRFDVKIEVFDNYVNSPNRVLKSDGVLNIIEEDREYSFSLRKESIGHNERENHISIFGMDKQNEYLIRATDTTNKEAKYVQFFINNEYKGLYTFDHNEGRRTDNFERNRANNK